MYSFFLAVHRNQKTKNKKQNHYCKQFYECSYLKKITLARFACLCFRVSQELRVYMVLGDSVSTLDVCMDFEPCFKVYNLVSVHPQSMKLNQMANLNVRDLSFFFF